MNVLIADELSRMDRMRRELNLYRRAHSTLIEVGECNACPLEVSRCCGHPDFKGSKLLPLNLARKGKRLPEHCPLVNSGPAVIAARRA